MIPHQPPGHCPDIFPLDGLEGIPISSVAHDNTGMRHPSPMMERVSALTKPIPGAPVEFVHGILYI